MVGAINRPLPLMFISVHEISVSMLVSLCGTPGVGKTTVACELKRRGLHILSEREVVEDLKLFDSYDPESDEYVVDPSILGEGLACIREKLDTDTVIEGHLSYLAPSDLTVILRVHPRILKERLDGRDYPDSKVRDNTEAEMLGYILIKAWEEEDAANENGDWTELKPGGRIVLERDVTGMPPVEVADWIVGMIEAFREKKLSTLLHFRPGKVDWLEECAEWF
jgi:adenylate kinase